MKLLLDTHNLIWFLFGYKLLSMKAKAAIEDAKVHSFLSIVRLWEISIKQSIGKLDLPITDARLQQRLVENGISILPIMVEHTQIVKSLQFHHRDPFDRMLVSQPIVEGLSIEQPIPKSQNTT